MKIPYIKIYTADLLAKSRRLSAEQIGNAIIGICEQAFENDTQYSPENEAERAFFNMLLDWKNESIKGLKQKKLAGKKGGLNTQARHKLSDGSTACFSASSTLFKQTETETETEEEKKKIKKEKKRAENDKDNGTGIEIGTENEKENPQFADFWEIYPKKTTKKECLDWWRKNPAKRQAAIDGLEYYKRNTDPQYYLDPIRYLKRERWQDMPEDWQEPRAAAKPQEPQISAEERAEQERWNSLTEEERKAELDAYMAESGGPWKPGG